MGIEEVEAMDRDSWKRIIGRLTLIKIMGKTDVKQKEEDYKGREQNANKAASQCGQQEEEESDDDSIESSNINNENEGVT